jgi:GMP synthase (glutamine-hydrolysing)
MRIQCLQHVSFEGPAAIADWARSEHHVLRTARLYRGAPMPGLDGLDWLVIMGGPMSVHDVTTCPWLEGEKRLIRSAVERGKTVIGVCLGAQLIADALGARVFRGAHREIGWYDVELTPEAERSRVFGGLPRRIRVFHWHGDTFDLPGGAVRLAGSDSFPNQAFTYGERVLAMQFHLESTEEGVRRMVENCSHEIGDGPRVQSAGEILSASGEEFRRLHRALRHVLDRLAAR